MNGMTEEYGQARPLMEFGVLMLSDIYLSGWQKLNFGKPSPEIYLLFLKYTSWLTTHIIYPNLVARAIAV